MSENNTLLVASEAEEDALRTMEQKDDLVTFVVDSGATSHMVASSRGLTNITTETNVKVNVAGGAQLSSIGRGDMKVQTKDEHGKLWTITITGVMIVPGLGVNLLSISKMLERGAKTKFDLNNPHLEAGGRRTAIQRNGGLFRWTVRALDYKDHASALIVESPERWHRRLGHRSLDVIQDKESVGIEMREGAHVDGSKCSVCETSKHMHLSFPKKTVRGAKEPFELVHVDLTGPVEEPSLNDARYAVIFTDEFTRYVNMYAIEFKSSFIITLRKYLRDVKALGHQVRELWGKNAENEHDLWDTKRGIQGLRSDRGSEFVNEEVKQFCQNARILQTFSGPYSPQQQGISERRNRTLFDMVRAMLKDCKLSKDFWAEALNTAVYLCNRLPSRGKVSPYEALFGRCPKLGNLRIFGCRAFVQHPRDTIKKLDARAWEGIFIGYDDHNWRTYRIWDPVSATVKLGIHVTFDETVFPSPVCAAESEEPDIDIEVLTPNTHLRRAEGMGDTTPEAHHEEEPLIEPGEPPEGAEPPEEPAVMPIGNIRAIGRTHPMVLRGARVPEPVGEDRGGRIQMLPKGTRLPDHIALAVGDLMGYPKTFQEAMRSPDREKWMRAMQKELSALEKNDTWDLVPKPKNFPVIDVRWVFTMKCNNQGELDTAKARNVVKGYRQIEGINVFDTEAPVTRPVSIRTVFALTTMYDWDCQNMDVDTAFLNAPVEEEIYIRQPEGFERKGPNGEELVCRLKKSLYGLKQAPRNWNQVIDRWFKDYGLEPSPADSCLYLKRSGENVMVVLLWVDDLIICGNDPGEIARFKTAISKRFHMKDLGDLKRILGMEVTRDRKARVMTVKQQAYMKVLLGRFGMADCRPIGAPAEGDLLRDPNAGPDREYMAVVGSLLYLAMITRPDVAYAVQAMGRHLQASNESHFAAGKRILRYIYRGPKI